MPILAAAALTTQGCSRSPSRVRPPSIDAVAAGAAAMDQYDTNRDGKVDSTELAKGPGLNAALANLDRNNDNAVSADEVSERIRDWQESRIGQTSVMTTVTFRGRPLAGATVVFEPEAFLGPYVLPAVGTTNEDGVATMKTEGTDAPGVAPGLYLVRITKDGTDLPAKYNVETVLGVEVAHDSDYAQNDQNGPDFAL
ncbi:MAG: DUF4198 domain-containing protein [Pirellulaceae bacterium]|nr:DUF4198 domain-containing protein [Pirellulaceae bacterium]